MKVHELIDILNQYDGDREVLTVSFEYEDGTLDSDPFEVTATPSDAMRFFLDADGRHDEHKDALFIIPEFVLDLFNDWFKGWSEKHWINYEDNEVREDLIG